MVIQRWQSVLLLIVAVVMGMFSFLSLGQVQLPDYTLNFTAMGFTVEGEGVNIDPNFRQTFPFFAISLLSAIVPLISIFLFKNLRLQKTLCLIEALFLVAVMIIAGYEGYQSIPGGNISWSSMVVAPFIAIVAVAMAYSRISSDQRKLRDAERLR